MSISVTPTYLPSKVQEIDGRFLQRTVLAVSGLTAGKWGETQLADATNIYVTVGSGGATAGWINVEF